MGEQFPQNTRGHRPLSSAWFNRANAVLQAASHGVPGQTMGGIRSGSFGADSPQAKDFVLHSVVEDFVHDADEAVTMPAGAANGLFGAADEPVRIYDQSSLPFNDARVYKAVVLGLDPENMALDTAGGADVSLQVYRARKLTVSKVNPHLMVTNWAQGAFYIPRRPNGIESLGSEERAGEYVCASFDTCVGKIQPAFPITERACKAIAASSSDMVNVQVYTRTTGGLYSPTNTFINGVRCDWLGAKVARDDKLFISLIDGVWQVAFGERDTHAKHIHFTLTNALTASSQYALANVELYYEGDDPGTEVQVFNPSAGCTGTLYRFAGGAGCKGQAVWSERQQVWWIWQLDCQQSA